MVVIARPRVPTRRRRAPLLDRALGTSRRRRQLAYASLGAGLALLRPTLRRLAAVAAVTLLLVAAFAVWLVLRLT